MVGLRKDSKEFPVEVSFSEVVRDGRRIFTGFIGDVTERKQAEELRAAQAKQAAVHAEVSNMLASESNLSGILQG